MFALAFIDKFKINYLYKNTLTKRNLHSAFLFARAI